MHRSTLLKASVLVAVPRQAFARPLRTQPMAMAADPKYDIAVKGAEDKLGDCPFCQRALLTLEEKHVPYRTTLIDFDNKPQWLFDVNPEGSVPVMKELASGEWIVDSGKIVDYLEEKFPEPQLGTSESSPQIGLDVLGKMKAFISSSPEEADEKEAALVECLRNLDRHLAAGGAYIGGAAPCSTDMAVMPRLYHMQVATQFFRDWEMPAELSALQKYMDTFMQRDSWKNTFYSPELVIRGWSKHGIKRMVAAQ